MLVQHPESGVRDSEVFTDLEALNKAVPSVQSRCQFLCQFLVSQNETAALDSQALLTNCMNLYELVKLELDRLNMRPA